MLACDKFLSVGGCPDHVPQPTLPGHSTDHLWCCLRAGRCLCGQVLFAASEHAGVHWQVGWGARISGPLVPITQVPAGCYGVLGAHSHPRLGNLDWTLTAQERCPLPSTARNPRPIFTTAPPVLFWTSPHLHRTVPPCWRHVSRGAPAEHCLLPHPRSNWSRALPLPT